MKDKTTDFSENSAFLAIPHRSEDNLYPVSYCELRPFQISDTVNRTTYTLGYRLCIDGVYGIGYVRPVGRSHIQVCVFYPLPRNCA